MVRTICQYVNRRNGGCVLVLFIADNIFTIKPSENLQKITKSNGIFKIISRMNACCFMCNTCETNLMRNGTNMFGQYGTLQSGKRLHEVVSEIVEKPVKEDSVHSKILCSKCLQSCTEYDSTCVTVRAMKMAMLNKFKISLLNCNLNYEHYEVDVKSKVPVKTSNVAEKRMGKIVLPASKLQPLTPDLLLKVGKFAAVTKSNFVLDHSKSPPVMTMNNSLLSQAQTSHTDKQTDILTTLTNSLNENMSTTSDIRTLSLSSLTKDFLSAEDNLSNDVNDDDTMEIDEDCALSVVPVTSANGDLVLEVQGVKRQSSKPSTDNTDFIDVSVLQSLDIDNADSNDKFILGKLQILDDGDGDGDGDGEDEEHTIVLDGDNGSILRMVNGQRFVLDGNELMMVPDQQDNEQADAQDSNDEPQIELQVSGDEETANAIIAAAQLQGGAFIKVESGEMYQVKSVQSKEHDQALKMVERVDGKFRCMLCHNGQKDSPAPVGDAECTMRHLRAAHDARLYICRLCGDTQRRRADYTAHMAVHTKKGGAGSAGRARAGESRVHACRACGKTFASKYTLVAHHKTHADRPRPHKCKQCGKSFLTPQNLVQHEKTHSGLREFVCNICKKAFSTQHNLEVHGVVHSGAKPFVCGSCGKGFARRAELRDHLRIHTGERPFACDTCGATFSQRSNLHSHRRATHLNERRHKCAACGKQFKRKRLLDYHIKASHTGERPLKCDVCSSTFVYPEHYKKHVRTHSGERPYVCEICGKTFTTRDNRNTHRFVHSDKKPYECLACGAGFMRKHLLYEHMNCSGHIAESIVVNQPRVTKVSANIFENTEEDFNLEVPETKPIIGKNTLSLPDSNDPLFIQALTGDRTEATMLEAVDVSHLEHARIVDENGEMMRIIEVKLPSGDNGWVAVNN